MRYDFHNLTPYTQEELLQEFVDKYVTCVYMSDEEKMELVYKYYGAIISCFNRACEEEELLSLYKEFISMKIRFKIPYIVVTNEIYGLKNMLIRRGLAHKQLSSLLDIFYKINNLVAKMYLDEYTKNLIATNNIRLSSLSDVLELSIIKYYKFHLVWLSDVAKHIQDRDLHQFPELDPNMCAFGRWLKDDAKKIIQNNSKYKALENLHNHLHMIARKIYSVLPSEEYYILISYLEKCELISLNIGTELVLVDNIEINKKITKDSLTGALNRHALRSVFETQYELAFATESKFALAICDLDDFKYINDTYGHVVGDKILRLFVDTVKKNIRSSDVIIRYGGEEFVIMLPAIKHEQCLMILKKICKEFAKQEIDENGEKIMATVSIGAIVIKPELNFVATLVDDYIMLADKKLYKAKNSGKNKVEC